MLSRIFRITVFALFFVLITQPVWGFQRFIGTKFNYIELYRSQGKVKPLIKLLKDSDSVVRVNAAWALGEIGDNRAVEPLIKTLKDSNSGVRKYAVRALGEIGDNRAVEPLIKALQDSILITNNDAAMALDKIEPGWRKSEVAKKVVPMFIKRLNSSSSCTQESASWALGEIGDNRAVEPLIKALKDSDSDVRTYAEALKKLAPTIEQ